jgi:Uma2 family endonuclease
MALTESYQAATETLLTAEQFLPVAGELGRAELIAGRVRTTSPGGGSHGFDGYDLMMELGGWVRQHNLGRGSLAETGFLLSRDPDTVRAPDWAFIKADRVPPEFSPAFVEIVPDMVLEISSPSDRRAAVMEKVGAWLDAGVAVVWVLFLAQRCLVEYRPDGWVRRFAEDDTLVCEDLLEGFAVRLADVLRPLKG